MQRKGSRSLRRRSWRRNERRKRKEDKREEKRSRGEEVPAQEGGASSSTGPDVQMEVEAPGEEMSID